MNKLLGIIIFNSVMTMNAMETFLERPQSRAEECLNDKFKKYSPPLAIRKKVENIFSDSNFFNELEMQQDGIGFLKQKGFTVLQFTPSKSSAVVLANKELPDYVLKFMRISAPPVRERSRGGIARNIPIAPISTRVINAAELKELIHTLHLSHIVIPDKYFCCVNNIAVVVAKKVTFGNRTLKDLTKEEIIEILRFVFASQGVLDLKAKNIVLTQDNKIAFIDTEKDKIENKSEQEKNFKKYITDFKQSINPAYIKVVDQWLQEQGLAS